MLFALLALWVHIHPNLPVDVAITQEFQECQSPWLRFLAAYLIGGVLLGTALWVYLRLKKKEVLSTKGRGDKPV